MEQIENTAENIKNEIKESASEIGPSIRNNFENIQNSTSSNFSLDNFLFFFRPDVDQETICKLSQKLTVQIIGILSLICSLSYFFSSLDGGFLYKGLYKIIICVLFLIIAFYSFYSTINQNSDYTKIAYLCSAFIWSYCFIIWAFETLIDLFKFINFLGDEFLDIKEIFKDIGEACLLLIYLYFVWILYCYMVNLRTGRAL